MLQQPAANTAQTQIYSNIKMALMLSHIRLFFKWSQIFRDFNRTLAMFSMSANADDADIFEQLCC